MRLTPAQEVILRKRPQSTKLWLSIYKPKTLLAAMVSGTFSSGEIDINYDTVSAGSFSNVPSNTIVLIGTTAGGSDVGRIRVRSITSSAVKFAENEIVWRDNLHFTFIDFVDINAVYPRIIQDPSNQTNVIFYKDWDIPYSNQNTIYGTFPCMGPHRAGFITTGSFGTFYSSTGSYNVKGDSITFNWAFEGGTPTGSTLRDPGLVQYTTPGHYRTRLIITSSSGAIDTSYRYVSAYERPENGTNTPILKWELTNFSGSRGEGGYVVGIKMMQDIGLIEPNALVVIFAEDDYGGTLGSLGGNANNNSSIVFVGYVLSDSIQFDYKQSTVEFEVGSVSEVMKITEGFSVSCESKAVASTWFQLQEMTIQKAIYHYLRWHSTLLNVCDYQYTGDDRFVQYFDADRGSLFDAIESFVSSGVLGSTIADRQGKLWSEINYYGYTAPFSSIPSVPPVIDKQDWIAEPNITERKTSELAFVELGGIAYFGVTSNDFLALLTNAPGDSPLYRGNVERQQGLILLSQQQLNQISGNYLAHKNSPFPEVNMSLGGNYRNMDIVPQEQKFLLINPSDTVRNISIQNLPYRVSSMTWQYDSTKQSFVPDVTFEQMVTGTIGQTIIIPATPSDAGFSFPELSLPPLPNFNINVPSPGAQSQTTVILKDATSGNGLLYTTDFDAAQPVWSFMNGGLTVAQRDDIRRVIVTPNGSVWCIGDAQGASGNQFVAYAPAIGQPFTIVVDQAWLTAAYPAAVGNVRTVFAISFNPNFPEKVAFMAGYDNGGGYTTDIWIGDHNGFTKGATTTNNRAFPTVDLTFGADTWRLTPNNSNGTSANFTRYSLDGSTINLHTANIGAGLNNHMGNTERFIFYSGLGGTDIKNTLNNGTTISANISFSHAGSHGGLSDDGLYGMLPDTVAGKSRTSDEGATWGAIANLPPGGAYRFAWAGGQGVTSRWVAAKGIVRYSKDWGHTWLNKEGNLLTLLPIPNISLVYVVM